MRKVLVYRFSAIGDVTLLLPVLKGALDANADIEIHLLTKPFFAPLFQHIERLHFIGIDPKKEYPGVGGLFRLQQKLLQEVKPDLIIDLHQVLRTHLLHAFFRILHFKKVFTIDKGRAEKKRLVKSKAMHQLPSTVERYAACFEKAGLKVSLPAPPLLPVVGSEEIFNKLSPEEDLRGYRLIGIAPFSAHQQKEWGLPKFAQLLSSLQNMAPMKFLLFGGGKQELKQLWQLTKSLSDGCIVVGERLKFQDEIKLIPHLSLMISMDSANMHFAAMAGIPVISIWGATHPALGFAPYGQNPQNELQYSGKELNCRPCSVYGNKPCIYPGEVRCMSLLKVEDVSRRVVEILRTQPKKDG